MESLNVLKSKFANPPSECRSIPFWSWNDRLLPEELVRQVKEMKEKGMGGFFMHSREGLETEYLGEQWMECVKAAVKEAKNQGIGAWLYDEDRFPSGGAGGLVPAKGGDACRAKALTLEISSGQYINNGNILAVYRAVIDDDRIYKCNRLELNQDCATEQDEVFLVFRSEVSGPCEWYNNNAPTDNLSPYSVGVYIDTTHNAYKKELGKEFGSTVPGVFTDEPTISDFRGVYTEGRSWIPWTEGFDEYFTSKRGYDFLNVVPYIFFIGEKSTKARHDYWRTVTERFCEAFSKQIGTWCEKNGVAFTGHYVSENSLGFNVRQNGSVMSHYRYMHIPGIDMLREQTEEYMTIKQCTSVANQYGRKYAISEMYGCTGWDFTFEGQKWMGDWQYAMGINLRCQHQALYSLKGCRKRDFPPAFSYNTSWWKYNNIVEDYFARLSAVLSEGNAVRDVLVIHPVTTAWSMVGCYPYNNDVTKDKGIIEACRIGDQFNNFIKLLLGNHYDFDLGDEIIIEEKGRVEGNKMFVNKPGYSLVIIPSIKNLLSSTVDLLKQFLESGGKVIVVTPLPTLVDGEESSELKKVFHHENMIVVNELEQLGPTLEKMLPRKVSIRNKFLNEAPEFFYILRELNSCQSLFVVNNDRNNSYEVEINVEGKGGIEEWDLLTGKVREIGVMIKQDRESFIIKFGAGESKLFIIKNNKAPVIKEYTFEYKQPHFSRDIYTALGPSCGFTRTMPNALVLDKCSYRVEGGNWSESTDVWQSQRKVRDFLGMRQVYFNGGTQRYKWVDKAHPKDGVRVKFRFEFSVKQLPERDLFLILEEAGNYDINLNGISVLNEVEGWFIDKSFDKVKLEGVKEGYNELILSCNYKSNMEVEDCYIIGDFAVDTKRNIVSEPETLHFGDWCLQGYLHYCGSMVYHFDFEYDKAQNPLNKEVLLELGNYSAITVEVRVNAASAGQIPWKCANSIDISGFLRNGTNKIDVEVMGSPRNLFGPFHQAATNLPWTYWASFRREGTAYTPEYVVKPYGLMGQINIYKE